MKTHNIAFIPVRKGSKSIPGKNIRDFSGKPLLFWILDTLSYTNVFDQILIATDCLETERLVKNFYKNIRIYRRSDESSKDDSPSIDVVLEFLRSCDLPEGSVFFMVQATSPFTAPGDFYKGIKLIREEGCDSVVSCIRMKRFLWSESGQPLNYDLRRKPRRQSFDGFLAESGSFYASKVSCILETKQLLSGKVGIVEVDSINQIEMDEPIDWILGEAIMEYLKKKQNDGIRI